MTSSTHLLIAGWCFSVLCVTYASLTPGQAVNQPFIWGDKIQHLAAYAWLAWLQAQFIPDRQCTTFALALIAWGALMEIVQSWIPLRDMSLADSVANACGVALGHAINKHFPLHSITLSVARTNNKS